MRIQTILSAILVTLLIAVSTVAAASEVNVYSARKEALIKPLLDKFTASSGIRVNLVTGKADALLKRLEAEGRNTPADLFITVDVGRLHRAKAAGVLQPASSHALEEAVPETYRDPDGYWYGLSLRARPIMYVKGRVNPSELSSYEALADSQWKRRICIRGSGNIYNQSLVASMIAARSEAQAEKWAKAFVANFARSPKGGDRDQIKAAAAGQCDIAIANTYYLARMLKSKKDDAQRAAAEKMAVFWPNQADRGAHVNVSGAGITRYAQNRENARRLLEFLALPDSQAWYAEVNNEYPVRAGVAESAVVRSFGAFKADAVNLSRLGELNAAAVKLMDRAGWK
ncbi:MAG: Fe(3+) ABC transporter substrate-binding protein [Gammaproteobacteria bacterium]|nr:MAG: Fe(3+) ABC transporter substrate-binding protein [Gammaproteobacteria bacterium]